MNAKERLFARLKGATVDRVPNLNIVMQFAARQINVPYSAYCSDYRLMVQGNIACAIEYGLDGVTVMSDPMREAHDFGTNVVFPHDDVPHAQELLIQAKSDLAKLKPINPENGKRMMENIQAIQLYKRELGGDYPVFGWVEGCFAEAADLRGVTPFFMDVYDDPAFATELLDLCCEQAILYALAQIEAGADVVGVGDAIASVAGPHLYREFAAEYERRILSAIQDMGAKTKLHICGNIEPLLEYLPTDVIDILDVDWMVPLDKVTRICGGQCALSGNYDPVAVLLQGTPQIVEQSVRQCLQEGNNSYISAAGCEVPKGTPEANLKAVKCALSVLS